jgi:serine protease DegS
MNFSMKTIQAYIFPAVIGLTLAGVYFLLKQPLLQGLFAPSATTYANAVELALPAVVDVISIADSDQSADAIWQDPLLEEYRSQLSIAALNPPRLGSGIVIDDQGHVLTNFHVVRGAIEIRVKDHLGAEQVARLLGHDPETDLAVIKVSIPLTHPIQLQEQNPRVGDTVLAIGNPYGVGQTVTLGIISALGRSNLGLANIENYIQTDAAINPGNSGGALVDTQGYLVGVTSAVFSSTGSYQGISFAIPGRSAMEIAREIISSGQVRHGYLGIELRTPSDDEINFFGRDAKKGFLITRILAPSPASAGGIRGGDILLAIDGVRPASLQQAYAMIASLKPGTVSRLSLLRRGETLQLAITLAEKRSAGAKAE